MDSEASERLIFWCVHLRPKAGYLQRILVSVANLEPLCLIGSSVVLVTLAFHAAKVLLGQWMSVCFG